MVEILEGIFQPFDLWESCGHVDADFKESIAEADRYAHFRGKPADTHDICHLSVDIEQIRAMFSRRMRFPGISRYSPLLIWVQLTA